MSDRVVELAAPRAVNAATARSRAFLKQITHSCAVCKGSKFGGKCQTCTENTASIRALASTSRSHLFQRDFPNRRGKHQQGFGPL